MKPTKHSIAYVIYNVNRSRVLAVQRPADDVELPNLWGLPAGSLHLGETYDEAVIRSGVEKLGVDLAVSRLIADGALERPHYRLHLRLYEARVLRGELAAPQPYPGVTQYQALKWAMARDLIPAAQAGSLCCRLFLEAKLRQQ